MSEQKIATGSGRLLVTVYAIFALSATARASYQLVTKFSEAPLPYILSAVSALVYIVATVALAKNYRKLAEVSVVFELIGVLIVGSLSLLLPALFQHASVWTLFGANYAWIPLVLPIWGLWWLRKSQNA